MRVRLRITEGPAAGRMIEIDGRDRILVGRAPDLALGIDDPYLGRQHCWFDVVAPRIAVRDLGSRNGTLVNGTRVTEQELRAGDEVRAGQTAIVVEVAGDDGDQTIEGATESAPGPRGRPIEVRCAGCRAIQVAEALRDPGDAPIFHCATCREALYDAPPLPDGYQLVRELGRGAAGRVYLARHGVVGPRAVKVIIPAATTTARDREKLAREARVQFRLVHPNIVRVLDLIEPRPGVLAIVMELVDGVSADRLVDGGGLIDPVVAVAIAVQATHALEHAHGQQIVHRDVKESNLLVSRGVAGDLVVKLADFGLAKSLEDAGASGFTSTGAWAGTGPYVSPEQLLDYKRVGPATDLYALGVTLFHMLTGSFPRERARDEDWVVTILERPVVPIRQRAPSMPPRLAAVVDRAIARDPAARFTSAAELRAALFASEIVSG